MPKRSQRIHPNLDLDLDLGLGLGLDLDLNLDSDLGFSPRPTARMGNFQWPREATAPSTTF